MPSVDCIKKLQEIGTANICPAIAFYKDDKVLIGLRHYSSGSVWTMPGGRCQLGEIVEHALRREVAEETNITDFTIIELVSIFNGAKAGDVVYFFVGRTNQEPELQEPDKFSEWRWERLSNIPTNFIDSKALALLRPYVK